jgi:crotonobetainyl-CoA:carnitine CoA-transferase CaiB-like acyl-CoA transferase
MVDAEIPGADVMVDSRWTTLAFRRQPESIAWFVEVFETFTKQHTKEWLYREGQARGIAIAPVNTIADVRADDQLAARDYFRTVHDDAVDADVVYPGPAFRLHGYPSREWSSAPITGADTASVLGEWLGAVEPILDLDATG